MVRGETRARLPAYNKTKVLHRKHHIECVPLCIALHAHTHSYTHLTRAQTMLTKMMIRLRNGPNRRSCLLPIFPIYVPIKWPHCQFLGCGKIITNILFLFRSFYSYITGANHPHTYTTANNSGYIQQQWAELLIWNDNDLGRNWWFRWMKIELVFEWDLGIWYGLWMMV